MERVSNYNIYLNLKKNENKYLLIQGYRGSFDVVDDFVAEKLIKAEKDSSFLSEFDKDVYDVLKKRGYITEKSIEEEKETIKKVSHTLNKICRKNICLTIMPTYNCNFRCVYCFEQNLLTKGKEWLCEKMKKETVDAVFEQVKKYREDGLKVTDVYLFGGEPLLRTNKDIVEYICNKCRELDIPISCISNGYDLNEYIDIVKEFKFQRIQITIDGIGAEHDKRRFLAGGQGSYERIKSNIKLALDNGINILLRSNINKNNIGSVKELIKEYEKEGWTKYKNFNYYFKSTLRCYEKVGNALSEVELMKELASDIGEDVNRFEFNSIYQGLAKSITNMLNNNSIAPLRSGYCGANTGMYTIDPYGDIYPCWDVLAQEKCKIGKVDLEKGEFIFNDNHDIWKERTVDKIEDCKNCKYMLFCGGGCSAQAKVMNKDMNKVFCDDFTNIFDEVAVDVVDKKLLETS